MADDGSVEAKRRLNALEDAELRQLTWFGLAGDLSEQSRERIEELRSRDRRDDVRDPRPDPISQESDGRRYISDSGPDPSVDDRPEANRMASCYNCGYAPLERGSLCPHCAVRSYAV